MQEYKKFPYCKENTKDKGKLKGALYGTVKVFCSGIETVQYESQQISPFYIRQ